MNPSGVITNPEPFPLSSRSPPRALTRCFTSILATAGAIRATALTTVREYASSSSESSSCVSPRIGCEVPESVSWKRKSMPPLLFFGGAVMLMDLISDAENQQSTTRDPEPYAPSRMLPSSLHLLVGCFTQGPCQRPLQFPPCSIRAVPPGWYSTALLTNGLRSSFRFLQAARCVTPLFNARSAEFLRKCSRRPCAASSATAWCNAWCIRLYRPK